VFQHTVLCQTSLPYRDAGGDVRESTRVNGVTHLKVLAGDDAPRAGGLVPTGLPYGAGPIATEPKVRFNG
jgi:hypothetical protein